MDSRPLTLFYSYSHKDEDLRDALQTHLAGLKRDGLIEQWYDREIPAGSEWDGQIRQHLEEAEIILFLVSADFMASDYCNDVEVARAMELHEAGAARAIPVILRACDWESAPFGKIQGAPKNALAVTSWPNRDEAFTDVAKAIRRTITKMQVQPPTTPASGRLWNIPQSTRTFTGRKSLLEKVEATLEQGDRVALTALHGLGGIGKTQIALEFADRHRANYDVGWFLRAEEPGVLTSDLSELAARLGIAERTAGPEATLAALRHWWVTHDRWLLIYDNAETAAALKDALPTDGAGDVLITSRSEAWRGTAEPVSVRKLDRTESIALLLKRSGAGDDQHAEADRLAEALGDLPLALEHAGAFVDASGITLAAYLDLFEKRRQEILADIPEDSAYGESVAATWSLSFERAEAECPAAGGLLRLCAFLAPDEIPGDRLRAWENWPPPLDEVSTDPLVWPRALQALRRHSLIRPDGDLLFVHRLVQAVTLDRMNEEKRETWLHASQDWVREMMSVDMPTMSGRMEEFAALVPHALAVTEFEAGDADTRSYVVDRAATFAQLRADFADAEHLFRRALAINEVTHGPDHPMVASRVSNLGGVLRARGDLDGAEDALQRALAIDEAAYGPDHPTVAIRVNNLGTVFLDRGDLDGAEDAFRRALDIDEVAHGPNHPTVANRLSNLGDVLRARGDLDGAEDALQRALAIDETAYGPDHPDVARDVNNLGSVLMARGDLDGAEDAYRRALAIDEDAYGPDHPHVAIYAGNLGGVLRARGDLDGAEDAFRRALTTFERFLGTDHPNTQAVRSNLEAVLREQEQP